MSDTALQTLDVDTLDPSHDGDLRDYVENASRYDGSRTPPQKTALVHALKRAGRSQTAIASILGMNERTVKAILSRSDHLVSDARMLLQANALGFAGDAIQASQEAAKRGKLEGISAMLDRLGVTEPPKTNAGVQVGVQVVLHGGEIPKELGLSPAKVVETSEGLQNQAENGHVNITPLTGHCNSLPANDLQTPSISHTQAGAGADSACVLEQDNLTIQAQKATIATGGEQP